MKKYLLFILLLLPGFVSAQEITDKCKIESKGTIYNELFDNDFTTKVKFNKDEVIDITCSNNASYVYINFDNKSVPGTLETNQLYKVGENGFLHELINIAPMTEMSLSFEDSYTISDIYVFDNELPDWVQDWQKLDEADMMLFSTHSDDEQLFFAGLLPTYADRNKKIMVVYYTNHYNDISRYHELLNGLWTLGIKYYPEISSFPDAYSETLEDALSNLNASGFTEEDAIKFQVDMIRKYKPKVVVGHDEKGEYSHGQHILNTYTLKKAIVKAADKNYFTENNYDAYQINKLYLHLYENNPIVMDYDQPLTSFGGKTAYEVAKEGYAKHLSQQYTWFTDWLLGPDRDFTKMTQVDSYIPNTLRNTGPFSPCKFGLYYTNVGDDINKNDMFENIKDEGLIDDKEEKPEPVVVSRTKGNEFKINKMMVLGVILILVSIIGLILIIRKIKKNN